MLNRKKLNQLQALLLSIFFAGVCLFTVTTNADMCLDLFRDENTVRERTAQGSVRAQQQVKVPKRFEDNVRSALKSVLATRKVALKDVDMESSVAAVIEGVSKLNGQVTATNFINKFMSYDALTRQFVMDQLTFLDPDSLTGRPRFNFVSSVSRQHYRGDVAEVIVEMLNPKEGTFSPTERAHFDYVIYNYGQPGFNYNAKTRLIALQVLQSKLAPENLTQKLLVTQTAAQFLARKADADPFVEQALASYMKTVEDLIEITNYPYKYVMAELEITILRRHQLGLNQKSVPLRFLRTILFTPESSRSSALIYIMAIHSITPLKVLPELEQIMWQYLGRYPDTMSDMSLRALNPAAFDKFKRDYQL